jgi:hypothetical protein
VEVVVANAGNVAESHVTLTASLTPVATPPAKRGKSASAATTSTVASARPTSDSVSHVIDSFAAGGSRDLTLPLLKCVPGAGYVLKVSFGGETRSLRLQVAAA